MACAHRRTTRRRVVTQIPREFLEIHVIKGRARAASHSVQHVAEFAAANASSHFEAKQEETCCQPTCVCTWRREDIRAFILFAWANTNMRVHMYVHTPSYLHNIHGHVSSYIHACIYARGTHTHHELLETCSSADSFHRAQDAAGPALRRNG